MLNRICPIFLLIMLMCVGSIHAQFGFSHEIGFVIGPNAFQSDYGERNDFDTNIGNVGLELGVVHYLNFSYRAECNCFTRYTFFNDHFKVRNELTLTTVNLEHFGRYVGDDKVSLTANQLRAMHGNTKVLNVGTQLEFFPRSIREFESGGALLAPYAALGVQYNYYIPTVESDLGPLSDPTVLPIKYQNAFRNESGSTWSVVASIGTRYKFTEVSDLLFDVRWRYYFSNWVDGLNPDENLYPENKANDWGFVINVGYIYYLNF
ncbi:hypothetical protein IMCC3317_31170 [Kordia antarctica]|uniref:Glutamate dehydrogenase n=1 Tax=Kordia antarctica TaxID=1218801 RepID=A0A7L4ZNG8_9FLAO|nr:glutamate dehydrogenase [Kordia antarctica]QHI37736.1 hypothetical protein IMCC3317_31170 [Kordia antarctica]